MPYSEEIAKRIRHVLKRHRGFREQKMFGGLAFMHNGNMCCGVIEEKLVLRLGKEGSEDVLREPFTAPFNFTGKVLSSIVYVLPHGYETDENFKEWIGLAYKFTKNLPPK